MKLVPRILVAALIGFTCAFGFCFVFLHWSDRPRLDQILLLFLPTAAFGYLAFFLLKLPDDIFKDRSTRISFSFADILPFIREHAAGILLALFFFCVYFYVGLRLNPAHLDTVDNYLDADNSSWMHRIADPLGGGLEMRGPHPYAFLIFRPLGLLLNVFTRNFALSAILLNTLAGGLCVFFAWFYFRRQTQNAPYALLMAALLGLSTAHFFLGSVVETYIFSALFLILFFVFLQKDETSISHLILISVITFGITLTNFVQTFLGFLVSRPRIKEVIRFAGVTLSLGIILGLLQAALYPSSKLFFLLSGASAEEEFVFSPLHEPTWRVVGRIILLIRTIFLYAVVAPRPYVFTTEVGGTFPRFNFFKMAPETFSYSSYDGLGNVLIVAWAILLFSASLLFVMDLFRTRKVDPRLGLVLCVLFNFVLHFFYGYEPFLYSPDWTYALIFFVALSVAPFARNKILQAGMFIFVIGLAINQWQFFGFIFDTIAPFLR